MIDMTQWAGKVHWIILFLGLGITMMIFPSKVLGFFMPIFRALKNIILGYRGAYYPQKDKAPYWAKYVAQDVTGEWRWHKDMPVLKEGYWRSLSPTFDRAGYSKATRYKDTVIKVVDLDAINWEMYNKNDNG